MALSTSKLWPWGVNNLFQLYYGRNATKDELSYWSNKSDAELRPKLVQNSATQLAINRPQQQQPQQTKTTTAPMTTRELSLGLANGQITNQSQVDARVASGGFQDVSGNVTQPPATKKETTPTQPTKEKTSAELEAEKQAAADRAQSDAINAYIESLGLDDSQKMILRQVAKESYSTWTKFYDPKDVDKLLATAAENAKTSLDPYYTKMDTRTVEDLKNKMADIRNQAALYTQNEQKSYAEKLAETKASLRARGLTFSGVNRKTLGKESAITADWVEWTLPQQRRYDVSTAMNKFQTDARDAWLKAERELGSANLNNFQSELGTIADPYKWWVDYNAGNTKSLYEVSKIWTPWYVSTWDSALDRLKEIEKRKWDNIRALAPNK